MNAATAPNFSELANTPLDEVERPKPYPVGSYLCTVKGLPDTGKSAKKQTPFYSFILIPTAALEDVDTTALEEMGGLERPIKATYYLTEGSLWRIKKFFEDCGVDITGKTIEQAVEQTVNKQIIAVMKHEASQDGEAVFAKLADTAMAE